MRAGELTHRLTLEQRVQAAFGAASMATTYTTIGQVWGSVTAVKADTFIDGVQVTPGTTQRILIRYRSSVDFDHISHGTGRWRVVGTQDPDGRRDRLEVFVERMTPE